MTRLLFFVFFIISSMAVFADIIPIEEIKPGMKGVCFSVIEGEKIEAFDAEIIKVVKGQNSIKDMIMVKLSGEVFKKAGGISEGMSGSPLYINDRFAGALSYTLEGAANNIALLTPAADIIKLSRYDDIAVAAPQNVEQMAKPGMAVAVTPVKGDVTLDVIATLSYVDGNKLYVMGHPITGKGNMRYFVNRAVVDYSVPSSDVPFKIARGVETVGLITQDRDAGLSGYITKDVRSCRINLDVKTKIETKKIAYDIVSDDNTMSEYFTAALEAGLNKASDTNGNKVSKYYFEVIDETNAVIYKNSDMLYMGEDIIDSTAEVISNEILNLIENPYKKMRMKRINIKVELSENRDTAVIKDYNIQKNVFTLGETIELAVNYHVFRRGLFRERIKIAIPPTFKVGVYSIKIYAGSEEKKYETEFNDYDSYYQFYRNQYKNNEIIVKIFRKDDTAAMNNFIEHRTLLTNFVTLAKEIAGEIIIDSFEATEN